DIMKSQTADENMRTYVEASESTAMRLKGLSDDLFNYFLAFGSTKENFNIEKYDAKTLVEQLLSEPVILLEEKGFDVKFEHGEELFAEGTEVLTDAPKLMRIVDNLFSNLSKYADPAHPISVTLGSDADGIVLEIRNRKRNDEITAESNGIGLKTCERLASFVAKSFEYSDDGESFTVKLVLDTSSEKSPLE
ncbi:MAG: HAMP domain-containing histidine kinase, partial [Clostridia bacterium]|nr:HAMP domain-containing histidine kinase [Clostridia bacterium]